MLIRKLHRGQRGDTIVEVMIVLAVIGLALGIAYSTANRSLLNARQAQENSAATSVAQTQVERIISIGCTSGNPLCDISDASSPGYKLIHPPGGGAFCIAPPAAPGQMPQVVPSTNAACSDEAGLPGSSIQITCLNSCAAPRVFEVKISWADVLGQGNDTVTQDYTLPDTTAPPVGGIIIGGPVVGGGVVSPSLAVTGCSGPVGSGWSGKSCETGDMLSISVTGVKSGDTCVIRNDNGDGSGKKIATFTASSTGCGGSVRFNKLGNNQKEYLTAYVTDSGLNYQSGSLTFISWSKIPIYTSCNWPGSDHAYGGVNYSNWVYTAAPNGCPSGTTQCIAGVNCVSGNIEGYANVACRYGSTYVYGSTWNGHDNSATPCPPGTTRVSMANKPPPGSPEPRIDKLAEGSGRAAFA